MLLFLVILWLALFGAMQGGKMGAAHRRAGGVVGAVLRGIGGFATVPVVLFAWEIVWRLGGCATNNEQLTND